MEKYKLHVYCPNCDFRGEIEIPKGIRYDEHLCSQCEVAGMIKDTPITSESLHQFDL